MFCLGFAQTKGNSIAFGNENFGIAMYFPLNINFKNISELNELNDNKSWINQVWVCINRL